MNDSDDSTPLEAAGVVVAVCVSPGGVPKHLVDRAAVVGSGLIGDGHDHEKHCHPDRAVSIQDLELLDQLVAEGYPVGPGILGENLTVKGVQVQRLTVGDRLYFEGGPILELACVRKPCYVLDSIHPNLKEIVVGRCGYLCRVVKPGPLFAGQRVHVERC